VVERRGARESLRRPLPDRPLEGGNVDLHRGWGQSEHLTLLAQHDILGTAERLSDEQHTRVRTLPESPSDVD